MIFARGAITALLLVAGAACAGKHFSDLAPWDFNTDSDLFLGGSALSILEHYGEPERRDTLDYEVFVDMRWTYATQQFTLYMFGRPYSWTITARGPETYRGLRVGDTLVDARRLYGRPSDAWAESDTTYIKWVMAPRWYPQYGIQVAAVRDTIRTITVGELLLVIM